MQKRRLRSDATRIYARRERYAVPALDKAMEVLDLLGGSASGLTVSEIGEKLGRSVGEIYRVVMSLEDIQLIRREEGERDRYVSSVVYVSGQDRHIHELSLAPV